MFDTESCQWITDPVLPTLQAARIEHSSCATDQAALIYGGRAQINQYLNSIEYLVIDKLFDAQSRQIDRRWISLEINQFEARKHSLMANVCQNQILIVGGYGGIPAIWYGNGVIFDTEQKRVVRTLLAAFPFDCTRNTCFATESESVVAIVETGTK